jgi:mono/diheme cytochrome c family protein
MNLTHSDHPRGRNAFLVARFALVLSALALGVLAGCGGGSSSSTDNTSTSTPPATTPSTPAPDTTPSANAGANETAEAMGQRVYTTRCALCHGPDGRGDGPGAAALNPKPRNYHDKAYMATRTDAELLEVIRNGKGAMPKWGTILSEDEMKAVLAHVRGLGSKP